MKYSHVLFDLDGTLTESGEGIVRSAAYAIQKLGYTVKDYRQLYRFIGPPLVESLMRYYGTSKEEAERGVTYYREYYSVKGIYENRLYDGISQCLKCLREAGIKVCMATSKPEHYAVQIAEHFHISPYFTRICGATLDGTRIEKGDVIRYALEELKVTEEDRKHILMVGDRENDVIGAKENKLDVLGVLYGYGDRKELVDAGVDFLAETPEQIVHFVLSGQEDK